MATDLEASRMMVRHGARLIDEGEENYTMYCAMAKRFATDKCWYVVNDCL
jgi:alkylation response protein AidB-like acyl-CoA dehydrogenase